MSHAVIIKNAVKKYGDFTAFKLNKVASFLLLVFFKSLIPLTRTKGPSIFRNPICSDGGVGIWLFLGK